MEELPVAYNKTNARFVYAKLREKIMEALFELQHETSIYISNHSEAEHTAYVLAIKCLEQLDDWGMVTWRTDGVSMNDSTYSEEAKKDFWKNFIMVDGEQKD